MNSENPTFKLDEVWEDKTTEEPLPVKIPSFRSRFLARLTPITALNRSVSVPHRTQTSHPTSPKPVGDKWRPFQSGSVPVTPNSATIPGGNAPAYDYFQSIEGNLKPNDSRASVFLRRAKSQRSTSDSKKSRISSSLPETGWVSYFDQISQCEPNTTSHFKDPILADLDSQIPDPIPPPRTFPPWLKIALQKQASVQSERLTGNDGCTTQHLSLPYITSEAPDTPASSFPVLQRQKSASADGTRICPIMQNGVKRSDTHYWLIPPHRPRPNPLLGDNTATEGSSFVNSPQEYLNASFEPKLRRNQSAVTADMVNSFQNDKIRRLKLQVPRASDEECAAVLIGAKYDYDEALHRLQLELMCKQCRASKTQCKKLLQKNNWDLEKAISEVTMILKDGCGDNKHKRRPQKLSTYSFSRQDLLPSPLEFSTGYLPQRSNPEVTRPTNAEQESVSPGHLSSKPLKDSSADSCWLLRSDHTECDSPKKEVTFL